MILFVFEGSDDRKVMNTLKVLYPKAFSEDVVCLYNNNIYQLYSKMRSSESDPEFTESLLSVLQKRLIDNETIAKADEDTFSQIFLFFDYEPQHRKPNEETVDLKTLNSQLKEMLSFFDDETENGKLYISYPMVEALFYTKTLPDYNFISSIIKLSEAKKFKDIAHNYSDYKSTDFLLFNNHELAGKKQPRKYILPNWKMVIEQNVIKANYICNNLKDFPKAKESVLQARIFDKQLEKYISKEEIAVLSAYPMFLFEYLKEL